MSKRFTALTASISVLASVIVLIVAIPKGIDEYREDTTDVPSTSVSPVKSLSASQLLFTAHSALGPTSAVALGPGIWVVATHKISESGPVTISSSEGDTSVVQQLTTLPTSGISIMRCMSSCMHVEPVDTQYLTDPHTMKDLSDLQVVDSFSTQALSVTPSVALLSKSPDSPINIPAAINGIAVALDNDDHMVGIVVRKNHSNWLLGKKSLDLIVKWVSKFSTAS